MWKGERVPGVLLSAEHELRLVLSGRRLPDRKTTSGKHFYHMKL